MGRGRRACKRRGRKRRGEEALDGGGGGGRRRRRWLTLTVCHGIERGGGNELGVSAGTGIGMAVFP
jgi:hypothetical protein